MPAEGRLLRLAARASAHARWAPLVAVVLSLPALFAPLFADDVLHRLVLDGVDVGLGTTPDALYRFVPRDEALVGELAVSGRMPWWVDRTLALDFYRPLTSATLALDHRIAPWNPVVAHLQSMLWTALLVLCAHRLHLRLVPERAGLASLLFACSTALTFSSAWVACRHVLIGGVAVAIALDRWLAADEDEAPAVRARLVGLAVFAIGLTASEGVVAAPLAYVALSLRRPTPLRQLAWRALPSFAVLGAYLAFYAATGHGARGSGGYLDPIGAPLASSVAVLERLLAFVTDCYSGLPSDAAHGPPLVGFVALGVVLVFVLGRAGLAAPPVDRRRLVALMGAGLLMSLPGTLGFYGGRVLLAAQLATTAAVALLVDRALAGASSRRLATVLVGLLLVGAPVVRVLGSAGITYMSHASLDAARRSWAACPVASDHLIVGASDPSVAVYTPLYWFADGAPLDLSGRLLTLAPIPMRLTRTGERAVRLTPTRGRFFESDWEHLYRREIPDELAVDLEGATARWSAAENAIDYEVTDAARWEASCFLRWDGEALVRMELPAVGASSEIEWHPGPMGM